MQVLFLNLLVAVSKLAVGFVTSTVSMIADGMHSLMDAMSNVVGLIGITVAARPPDDDHPYGHHKLETIASFIIGALVLYTALGIAREAAHRLTSENSADVGPANIAVMLATLILNFGVSTYEMKAGRRERSAILQADALQTRSDMFVSSGVIIALFGVMAGYPILDPIAALLVTIAVLYSAYLIFRRAAASLSDSTTLSSREVEEAAMAVAGVHSVEKIRSRETDHVLSVDMHIRVDPHITVLEAHTITHEVKSAVQESTGASDVVIHTEPHNPDDDCPGPQQAI